MKEKLIGLIKAALDKLDINTKINTADTKINIAETNNQQHGDYACNIALVLSKQLKKNPHELASAIIAQLPPNDFIADISTAGPGFINFYIKPEGFKFILENIYTQKNKYGHSTLGAQKKVHLEFVSSNPTGPLHVGHGRGATYGATLGDLLDAVGYHVHREYYVNDAGRQMDILAASIYLRYLEYCGEKIDFPLNGYQGDYIKKIAELIYKTHQKNYYQDINLILKNIPDNTEENKEIYIDIIITNIQTLLGEKDYQAIFQTGLDIILADMKDDLAQFGVVFQAWFSEKYLWTSGLAQEAIESLRKKNLLYEKDGATWFKSTEFGDDKDRVVIRENGQYTYFASDIAYHKFKLDHYDEVINVLGADHHGYIPRLKAIILALGYPVEKFHVPLVQFATLYRGKERIPMSTRAGSFVTLRELREEIGKDAARFFYISRKANQHLDFDLELAKTQSNENPIFYVQYAHARICSIFRQLAQKQLLFDKAAGLAGLALLTTPHEKDLFVLLGRYPEVIELAATCYEPHLVAHYLRELSESFHRYYNSALFLVPDEALRQARLCLIDAARQILSNGLQLLSVSAPESM